MTRFALREKTPSWRTRKLLEKGIPLLCMLRLEGRSMYYLQSAFADLIKHTAL